MVKKEGSELQPKDKRIKNKMRWGKKDRNIVVNPVYIFIVQMSLRKHQH
jgi:hypothetical protein